jgi:hypothetical protein
MADKADKKYTVVLDFYGTQGAWHALMQTEVKGRSASRNHDRCMKAIKTSCMKMRSEVDGDFVGGTITLDQDRFTYLKDIAEKKLTAGVPGSVGEGYAALLDAMDSAKDETEKVEVKA